MIPALVNLIIYLMALGILYAILVYVADNLLPNPPANIVKVVGVVIIGLVAVLLLLNLAGVNTGLDLPRVTT